MRVSTLAIGTLLMLTGCDAPPNQSEPAPEANEVVAAPTPVFQAISGENVFAMIIPANATADQLASAARDQCGQREFCQVHGWLNEGDAAKAMPMTDREVSTLAFQYAHNRATGFENRLWDCQRWPRDNADECLARD